jgi:hypothetical protein
LAESKTVETAAKDKSSGLKWDSFSCSSGNTVTNGESEFESHGFTDSYQEDYISVQCLGSQSAITQKTDNDRHPNSFGCALAVEISGLRQGMGE